MISRLLLLIGAVLLIGAAEPRPQPQPVDPIEGAERGRALVIEILAQKPARNFTNTGSIIVQRGNQRAVLPVRLEVAVTAGDSAVWSSAYATTGTASNITLTVIHAGAQPNAYRLADRETATNPTGNQTMVPFAGSDFWLADLGLEFFHWPQQRLLFKSAMRRSRTCRVLESVNPVPAPGAYSRVVSWIDIESDAPIYCEAYDFENQRLKEFLPKDIKKVDGEWRVEEMEMNNFQTGSRTTIKFPSDRH